MPRVRSHPPLGAVIEFSTRRGVAYGQYALDGTEGEQLLRVLPGFFQQRPRDLASVVAQRERFWEQVELSALLADDFAAVAGVEDVPRHARRHPAFRSPGLPDPFTGVIESWRIWDDRSVTVVPVDELTEEQRSLSLGGHAVRDDLVARIEEGWSPEDHRLEPIEPRPDAGRLRMTHVLGYKSRSEADRGARAVEEAGFLDPAVKREHGEWVATAQEQAVAWDQRRSEAVLERIARATGGEYIGYDYPRDPPGDDIAEAVSHTLVVATEVDARRATGRLRRDFEAPSYRRSGDEWHVTAREPLDGYDREISHALLQSAAAELGGTYLGDAFEHGDL